jgi:hypothetical protein
MSRLITSAVFVLLFVTVQEAAAQGTAANVPNFSPYWRQGLPPYLNLARGGSAAINYYLGTIPEQERRSNFDYLSLELQDISNRSLTSARGENLINPILPGGPQKLTGASPAFGNLGGNFGNTEGFFGDAGPRFGVVQQTKVGEPVSRRRSP